MEATNVFVQEAFILMALVLSVLRIVHKVQGGYSILILLLTRAEFFNYKGTAFFGVGIKSLDE